MLRTYTVNLEPLGQLAETAPEVVLFDEIPDVVVEWEIEIDLLEEGSLILGERKVGEDLEQVREVVSSVETDPIYLLVQDQA